jgi:ABC-type polysaccharide/polyol phosphate export permease
LASLLTLLTFASPIVYPESQASGAVRALLLGNPFTHLLRLYRSPLEPLGWRSTLVSAAVATATVLVLVAVGHATRRRLWWKARDVL